MAQRPLGRGRRRRRRPRPRGVLPLRSRASVARGGFILLVRVRVGVGVRGRGCLLAYFLTYMCTFQAPPMVSAEAPVAGSRYPELYPRADLTCCHLGGSCCAPDGRSSGGTSVLPERRPFTCGGDGWGCGALTPTGGFGECWQHPQRLRLFGPPLALRVRPLCCLGRRHPLALRMNRPLRLGRPREAAARVEQVDRRGWHPRSAVDLPHARRVSRFAHLVA